MGKSTKTGKTVKRITTKDAVVTAIVMIAMSVIASSLTRTWRTSSIAGNTPVLPLAGSLKDAATSVRLEAPGEMYSVGESVPVAIVLGTGGMPVVATDLILSFDASIFEPDLQVVLQPDYFRSAGIETLDTGELVVSLFVNTDVGHRPVVLEQDTIVATVSFTVRSKMPGRHTFDILSQSSGIRPVVTGVYTTDISGEQRVRNIVQDFSGVSVSLR